MLTTFDAPANGLHGESIVAIVSHLIFRQYVNKQHLKFRQRSQSDYQNGNTGVIEASLLIACINTSETYILPQYCYADCCSGEQIHLNRTLN